MTDTLDVTVSVTEQQAISFLKSRGYDVFEKVPDDWAKVGDDALGAWWVKLRNWQTNVVHSSQIQRDQISREIERREL